MVIDPLQFSARISQWNPRPASVHIIVIATINKRQLDFPENRSGENFSDIFLSSDSRISRVSIRALFPILRG